MLHLLYRQHASPRVLAFGVFVCRPASDVTKRRQVERGPPWRTSGGRTSWSRCSQHVILFVVINLDRPDVECSARHQTVITTPKWLLIQLPFGYQFIINSLPPRLTHRVMAMKHWARHRRSLVYWVDATIVVRDSSCTYQWVTEATMQTFFHFN